MKNIEMECPRCHTKWEVNKKTAQNIIECPHCHKKMVHDLRTQRLMKYIRYFVMLIIACGFAYGMQEFTNSNSLVIIISIMALAFILMRYIDELCRIVGFGIFRFSYMDYDEYVKIMEARNKKKGKK